MAKYVTNIFWSGSWSANGGKVYVLYTDGTYDIIKTQHNPSDRNKDEQTFKAFANLGILRRDRYSADEAKRYIASKDYEFEKWR